MGDLDKNIYRKEDPSPYEKIIVNPIEKDKREKEEGYKSVKNATRSQVLATLLSYFKKITHTLASKAKIDPFDTQNLLENINAFKQLLLILAQEDLSHHPDFAEQLSQLWHNILDDCNSLCFSEDPLPETMGKIKFFISQVQHFPLGADHTLGYYFSQYAGKEWIPFPFMELLQNLHEEYQASPVISVLQSWIALLNEILSSGEKKVDPL